MGLRSAGLMREEVEVITVRGLAVGQDRPLKVGAGFTTLMGADCWTMAVAGMTGLKPEGAG